MASALNVLSKESQVQFVVKNGEVEELGACFVKTVHQNVS